MSFSSADNYPSSASAGSTPSTDETSSSSTGAPRLSVLSKGVLHTPEIPPCCTKNTLRIERDIRDITDIIRRKYVALAYYQRNHTSACSRLIAAGVVADITMAEVYAHRIHGVGTTLNDCGGRELSKIMIGRLLRGIEELQTELRDLILGE